MKYKIDIKEESIDLHVQAESQDELDRLMRLKDVDVQIYYDPPEFTLSDADIEKYGMEGFNNDDD